MYYIGNRRDFVEFQPKAISKYYRIWRSIELILVSRVHNKERRESITLVHMVVAQPAKSTIQFAIPT